MPKFHPADTKQNKTNLSMGDGRQFLKSEVQVSKVNTLESGRFESGK